MPALEKIAGFAAISFVFSLIRTLLGPHKKNPIRYFISAFVAVPVGVIAGYVSMDYGLGQGITFAFVAISALLSENIVTALINFGTELQKDPSEAINKLKRMVWK